MRCKAYGLMTKKRCMFEASIHGYCMLHYKALMPKVKTIYGGKNDMPKLKERK